MREIGPAAAGRATLGAAALACTLAGALALAFIDSAAAAPRPHERRQGDADLTVDSTMVTKAMVDAGRAIFHEQGLCFACHGGQLEGTQVAPTLKSHVWRDAKNGDLQAILGVIAKGVPSTAMVSFPGGISHADARNVASYVWSVGRGRAKP